MRHLRREVNLFEAVIYALCVIIGAGIYVLVGTAAGEAGNGVWLSFLFAALIAGCTGLSYAELSSKMPVDAAEYAYAMRAFGNRKFAFGIGWLKLVAAVIAAAAVSLGFAGYFSHLTGVDPLWAALGLVVAAAALNMYGTKSTLEVETAFVAITILGLLIVVFSGLGHLGSVDYFDLQFGWGGVFSAAALIFFAFLGFEDVANLGEETKDPKRILPRALIISIIISTIFYTAVSLVAISVVPWSELATSSSPLSTVASVTLGPSGAMLLAIVALFATGSTVFGLFFAYSRMIFGMAEKGSMPRAFLKISKRGAPYVAVAAIACVTALFVLMRDIKFVASVTDFGALFVFMFVNVALIVLRYKRDHLHGEFRVPLNIGRFPVLPAAGAAFCLYMLTRLDVWAAALSLGIMAVGMVFFSEFIEKRAAPIGAAS